MSSVRVASPLTKVRNHHPYRNFLSVAVGRCLIVTAYSVELSSPAELYVPRAGLQAARQSPDPCHAHPAGEAATGQETAAPAPAS